MIPVSDFEDMKFETAPESFYEELSNIDFNEEMQECLKALLIFLRQKHQTDDVFVGGDNSMSICKISFLQKDGIEDFDLLVELCVILEDNSVHVPACARKGEGLNLLGYFWKQRPENPVIVQKGDGMEFERVLLGTDGEFEPWNLHSWKRNFNKNQKITFATMTKKTNAMENDILEDSIKTS